MGCPLHFLRKVRRHEFWQQNVLHVIIFGSPYGVQTLSAVLCYRLSAGKQRRGKQKKSIQSTIDDQYEVENYPELIGGLGVFNSEVKTCGWLIELMQSSLRTFVFAARH